jgi:hypothetical protein
MSYADAQADFNRVTLMLWNLRNYFIGTYKTNSEAVKDNLDDYSVAGAGIITQSVRSQRQGYLQLQGQARTMLTQAATRVAEEISSPTLNQGTITDFEQFFRDWRAHMLAESSGGDNGETTPARAVTYAGDVAGGDGVQYVRLTVDELGQKIESGIHNEAVTAEVTGTQITGQNMGAVLSELYGEDGGEDNLDYRRGSGRQGITLPQVSPQQPGLARNNALLVSGIPITNDQAVTDANLNQWTLTNVAGTPLVRVRTTNLWRGKTYGIAVGGDATTLRVGQPMAGGNGDRYAPVLPFVVFRYDGTWQGTIKLTMGGESVEVGHAALGSAGFKYVMLPRDGKLYRVSHDAVNPRLEVEIATTSATGELVLQMIDAAESVVYQNIHYWSLPHDALPTQGVKRVWEDSVSFAGKRQDLIAWAYEEAPWAYLNTTGDIAWADPS